ncbi:MAG: type I restriction endonuclease subunit R [Ignavibacteria bacterium]|nr:type I restriction endonuclease subunit R [Ignavibacteria bacterium]
MKYDESTLVERPAIELFRAMHWQEGECFDEFEMFGGSPLGRQTKSEVVLFSRLRHSLKSINPDVDDESLSHAIAELTKDRSSLSLVNANRETYELLKNGFAVDETSAGGETDAGRIKFIDWENPENNDFLLCSQFWIAGEMYTRRADLVGFINGIPLVFIELKAIHKNLEHAYRDNLRDYKDTIPEIFRYNAFIIISNGSESRIGTITSKYEHFAEWKKINSEGEQGVVSLETMIKGTCEKKRILDLIENFILYAETRSGTEKMLAKYHQYFGVNAAFQEVEDIKKNKGRLGVFWHTQGSGKSYSMVFFAQKVLRKIGSNFTFVIVTDREDLDDQIYKNFAGAGVVKESEKRVRAQSVVHLKELLAEDHRYLFTLIHKFQAEQGMQYPEISRRSDVIVMTDEAHRSQYDTLALNMRNALPNAAFIGFTGTPLIVGEERTRDVFGDYVSKYDFKQSIEDNATVPLYYENRIPEMELVNNDLNDQIEQVIEDAMLDEAQESKLEREFSREYHLLTRDERLEKVAEDIVQHFMGRGQFGKAMVISIDRITAVRMFDKVKRSWVRYIANLERQLAASPDDKEREGIAGKIAFMSQTDMAVIISPAQNEVDDFRQKGIDILPLRKRMQGEDLDEKFKDPANPLRIVFVCAMWITGFDVPSCSTIYLDKPLKNHTLMQTIARANRVFGDKVSGLIVDYVGVFRNLQKALAIYGAAGGGDLPVKDKEALVSGLRTWIIEAERFCASLKISLDAIIGAEPLMKIRLIDDAVEAILRDEETKKNFLSQASLIHRIFQAILPDKKANEFHAKQSTLTVIADKIRSLGPEVDISSVTGQIEAILDRSVKIQPNAISDTKGTYGKAIDLSQIDFEKLKKQFEKSRKRTEVEKLKAMISLKLLALVALNKSRMDYMAQFQKMIDEYNAGSANVEQIFQQLVDFAQMLNDEEKRGLREGLSEEELAIFDILMKPAPEMKETEVKEVKKVARELLETLKRDRLVLEWRKRLQSRARVKLAIDESLDKLPKVFGKDLYDQKCQIVYQHVYDAYYGEGKSTYAGR